MRKNTQIIKNSKYNKEVFAYMYRDTCIGNCTINAYFMKLFSHQGKNRAIFKTSF